MKIVDIKIDELVPYENNPRFNDDAVDAVAKSIQEFGFKVPCVIDGNNNVITGHTRIKACKQLGMEEVPCVIADDLTEAQQRSFRLVDNRTAELSDWDFTKLDAELSDLMVDVDFTPTDWGFDTPETTTSSSDEDFEIIPPEKSKSKLGEIYQLGRHRIMCGDSTKKEDVEKLMDGEKADMVFTDPPYGIGIVDTITKKVGAENLAKNQVYEEVIGDDSTTTAKAFYNTCVSLGMMDFIIWGGNYFLDFLPFSSSWLVWDKRGTMNSNNFADGEMAWVSFHTRVRIYKQIWNGMIREGESERRVHPTQKPINTLANILGDFTEEADIVYDGFLGSGSTLIACEKTNRICYGMELSPIYIDVIIDRWENFTGETAAKL